jgi:transposase
VRPSCDWGGCVVEFLKPSQAEEELSMTIGLEREAQILRYYHAERWRIGTIARQLSLHYGTVQRVLAQAGLPKIGPAQRPSQIDPYLPFIAQTLEKFPTLTASRLYDMACERGYPGGPDHFRHLIALHRPRPKAEAYLRLRTLAGEQGQVDWAHFGHLQIGRAHRPLMAFVMVLSYSRRLFLRFFLDARMQSFLRGHVGAFEAWSGVPRILLYDNLKSAVLQRQGDAIRFHPTLLELAAHYRFEPRPVALARGNEKGRVERKPLIKSVERLNALATMLIKPGTPSFLLRLRPPAAMCLSLLLTRDGPLALLRSHHARCCVGDAPSTRQVTQSR